MHFNQVCSKALLEEIPSYDFIGSTIAQSALDGFAWQLTNGRKLGKFMYNEAVTVSEVNRTETEIDLEWNFSMNVCVEFNTPPGKVKADKHVLCGLNLITPAHPILQHVNTIEISIKSADNCDIGGQMYSQCSRLTLDGIGIVQMLF